MEKQNTPDLQTTPGDIDLEQILQDSQVRYEPPTDMNNPGDGPVPPSPADTPALENLPPQTPPPVVEPPAATPPVNQPPADGDHATPPETPADQHPPWFRFKTHPAAEEGYKNLRGQTTKLEQKVSEMTKELDALKNQAKEEERKEAEQQAIYDFAKERRKKMNEEIHALDPDADDYDDQHADILARADRDIKNFTWEPPKGTGDTPPATDTPPADQPPQPPVAGDHAAPPDTGEPKLSLRDDPAIQSEIEKMLPEFGLDSKDPVFAHFSAQAPITNGEGKAMDYTDQIGWVLGKTRDHMAGEAAKAQKIDPFDPVLVHYLNQEPLRDAADKFVPIPTQINNAIDKTKKYKAAQRSKTLQDGTAPLRSSTSSSPAPASKANKDVQPMELGDAVDETMKARRL